MYAIPDTISARQICLFLCLILYAVFGSATPDNPGVVEVIMAVLLILSASIPLFLRESKEKANSRWLGVFTIFFVFGLTLPLLIGVFKGHDDVQIFRDVIAFLFLCLPLFFFDRLHNDKIRFEWFMRGLLFIGLAFSVRALLPAYGFYEAPDELLYLANSPLVVFTALFLTLRVCHDVYEGRLSLITFMCGALAILPCMAMLIDVQRAPVSAVILSLVFFVIISLVIAPYRGMRLVLFFVLVSVLSIPVLTEIYTEIGNKTARVGFNMRLAELRAVFDAIDDSILTVLFGQGWGAQYAAPSVGGLYVGYTHSLLSYFILKGGIIGLGFMSAICVVIANMIYRIAIRHIPMGLTVFWPFVIPVLFYASYKSFDFGLILLFIILCVQIKENNNEFSFMGFSKSLPLGFKK